MYQVIKEKEQEEQALKNNQQGNQDGGYSSNLINSNVDSNSQPLIQENNQPADLGDLPTENEVVQNDGEGYQSNVINPNAPISSDLPPQPAANELPIIQNQPPISVPQPENNPNVVPLPSQPPFNNANVEGSYDSSAGYKPGANINFAPKPTGARPAIYDLPNQKAYPQPGVYPQPEPYNPQVYQPQPNAYANPYPQQPPAVYQGQNQVIYQPQPGGAYVPPGKQQGNFSSYNAAGQQVAPIVIKETVVQPVVVKEEKNKNQDDCAEICCCIFCCCLYCCLAGAGNK